MKKVKILLFMAVVAAAGLLSIKTQAKGDVSVPEVTKGIYVYDDADMISDDCEKNINSVLQKLESKTSAEVFVVSYTDSDLSLEKYATSLFNTIRIGKKDKNNGVLLLMQKEGNHVRLEVGSGIDDVITDSIAGAILDDYYVPYRQDSTSKAALETSNAIASNLYEYYGISNELTKEYDPIISANSKAENDSSSEEGSILGGVIVLLFCLLVPVGLEVMVTSLLELISKKRWAKTHNGDMHIWYAKKRQQKENYNHYLYDNSSYYDSSDSFGGGYSDGGGASR